MHFGVWLISWADEEWLHTAIKKSKLHLIKIQGYCIYLNNARAGAFITLEEVFIQQQQQP